MPKFFVSKNQIDGEFINITGEDAHHISRSLRMATGEKIVVSDGEGMDYDCLLEQFNPATVVARIISSKVADAEMPVRVHLFSALPKGEKLDLIIQKSVECGVFDITPFESERCVVKVKADAEERKTERRNKIALEAAKQCGRSIIPKVNSTISFQDMINSASKSNLVLFCYEGEGTLPLGAVCRKAKSEYKIDDIAIIIGSEGGFSPLEAEKCKDADFSMIGLGKRILRAETAAIAALSCLVYEFELT